MTLHPSLPRQLSGENIVVAPGVSDALGAILAEQAGFDTVYLSGASVAYTRFGRPDIGLVGMSEVAQVLSAICERTEIPIVVDADTGFGNALNVMRTIKMFETAGASAIQLEDQTLPKRCGHLSGKTLVPAAEMVGKIKAALDARRSEETLIVARTDGIAVEGFDAALDRAERYVEAGADVLFIEAPRTVEEMRSITGRFAGRIPLLANMVEGGRTPQSDAETLREIGYSLVIFPGSMVRAVARAAQEYLACLRDHGTTKPFANRMLDFDSLNKLVGTNDMLALGEGYDAQNFRDSDD